MSDAPRPSPSAGSPSGSPSGSRSGPASAHEPFSPPEPGVLGRLLSPFAGTLRVWNAESRRLMGARMPWVVGLLVALLAAGRAWSSAAIEAARYEAGHDPVSSGAAWAPLAEGLRAGLVLSALVLLILGARSLAGDRETWILRLGVTRSVSRTAQVLGRFLVGVPLVLGLAALALLGAWVGAGGTGDFGPLVIDNFEMLTADELFGETRRALLGVLPALLGTWAFALLVSVVAHGATGAVALVLGLAFAFDLLKAALGESMYWFFAAHAPSLADTSVLGELVSFARGNSDAYFEPAVYRAGLVLPGAEGLLCVLLAAWVLSRRAL